MGSIRTAGSRNTSRKESPRAYLGSGDQDDVAAVLNSSQRCDQRGFSGGDPFEGDEHPALFALAAPRYRGGTHAQRVGETTRRD